MTLIAWDERLELGVPKMDATHQEFVDLVSALGNAADEGLLDALDTLHRHTIEHFNMEDRWMAESGFGAMCHPGEHQNVLEVFRLVRERVVEGDAAIARKLATELGPWFENHAATMDTILVSHMARVGYDPENPQAFVPPQTDVPVHAADGCGCGPQDSDVQSPTSGSHSHSGACGNGDACHTEPSASHSA